ncbi:MAG: hypothetical protein FJX59_10960 [Alphaproteobacteria bacterium]|nr:hypothetical protein [Alphaproteobacteria bacterium]
MRFSAAITFAAMLTVFSAHAQSPLGDDVYVLPAKAASTVAMASWDDKGAVKSAKGADAGKAPAGAVSYSATSAHWPTGRVTVLNFSKAKGGVLHPITDETLLYVQSGAAQVDVGGKTVTLAEGDVVSKPSGAIKNAGGAGDAVIVTWNVGPLTGEATPTHVASGTVNAPAEGPVRPKRYNFPGNSVRAVKLMAGNKTNPASAKTDSLIYLTSGSLKFTQNGKEFDVGSGDFIRELAGLDHFWNITNDSSFVTTSALPIGAGPIDPANATDRR